ncbi:ribokinase [Evansella vedderi]|uniref:Ribokinase n=1 Tax=Evansella vedderi TaxID=38282 RepID=A0ABT9ZP26_9BACI|nr:ribokinase [Evansella vedderi]MDQ0252949.1 ribokinase [Evansella vedderi]
MNKILVVGSLNLDMVLKISEFPKVGETISCNEFLKINGGKGANQAVAASKLGADVSMIGKVGFGSEGRQILNGLEEVGVSTAGINFEKDENTGLAFITVNNNGENKIIISPGANYKLNSSDVDEHKQLIEQCDLLLIQLEIPIDVVEYTVKLASRLGKKVILNPAPMKMFSDQLLSKLYTLIMNETELEIMSGESAANDKEIEQAANKIKNKGVEKLIITLGKRGSLLLNNEETVFIPAFKVNTVDTTAAGDAFIAAFSVGKLKGMDDRSAIQFASKTSAIVVTKVGAQSSLPTLVEVDQFQEAL